MAAAALLCALCVRIEAAWPLAFVALVPWLALQRALRTLPARLLAAWAMTVGYTLAALGWFGGAIGGYTGIGDAAGTALLLLAAPLFAPQFLAHACADHLAARRSGGGRRVAIAVAAWLAAEWLLPRPLGDTFGHALQPSTWLSQLADLGGAPGLTLLLLVVNEALAAALARRHRGPRAFAVPLAAALLLPPLAAGYGALRLATLPAPGGPPLRVALVQPNLADYAALRREAGSHGAVRQVLDLHFAMSWDAVERQRADAVLWSETVYPTTFGQPKSADGAAFDREIVATVEAAGVPFVFGTYDRDARGEYNAAAFVAPGAGVVGIYRKTRLFPFSEAVPGWLDGPLLRRWLPWAGRWIPGDGARVLPLRLADGREIPVLPLICRDAVDPALAIAGARLGAQAILTLSNDGWFTGHPPGARLHLAVATFRSIETRLPQFRVTNDGLSAVIDPAGRVLASAPAGRRHLVIGEAAVGEPPWTLAAVWGDWVGPAAAIVLLLQGLANLCRRLPPPATRAAAARDPLAAAMLPAAVQRIAALLMLLSRGGALAIAASALWGDALQLPALAQLRGFAALVLAPGAAAWLLVRSWRAALSIDADGLVLQRGAQRHLLPAASIAAVAPWRLPWPGPGLTLHRTDGPPRRLVFDDAAALARACAAIRSAMPHTAPAAPGLADVLAEARAAGPATRLAAPAWKFGLLPLALALPAFRLHQQIAYGGTFGEALSFGWAAWLGAAMLWWAAWAIGVVLCAAVLRAAIGLGTLAAARRAPAAAARWHAALERFGLAALYLGLPAWLALRLLSG